MNLDFFDIFEVIDGILNLFGGGASTKIGYGRKSKTKKKSKYFIEKVSAGFLFFATALFFFVFRDFLPAKDYTQTIIVASLIGLAISLIFFFLLHVLEKYYFKSVFQWLFFSLSTILFFVSVVFCVYFKSGVFV